MMKTKFFYVAALILGLAFTTTSCSSDDDNPTVDPANIDYTPENASSWHNYMRNVAALLKTDATNLYNAFIHDFFHTAQGACVRRATMSLEQGRIRESATRLLSPVYVHPLSKEH